MDQTVTLTQQYLDDDMTRVRPGRIRLAVSVANKDVDDGDAADFQTLRREHPQAFYKYLLPALKELQRKA